jgi:hypothetical protein
VLIAAERVMLLAIDQREEMPPAIVSHVACAGNRARLPATPRLTAARSHCVE